MLPLTLEGDIRTSGGPVEQRQTAGTSALLTGERLLRTAKRWASWVVLAMVAGGLIAFGVSKLMAPEYRATTQLYLAPASNSMVAVQDVVAGQNLARSYVQLANATVVLKSAMERVGWSDIKTFRERASITQIRDTSIITISFLHGDPHYAADAANAIAEAFIAQSRTLQSSLQGTAVQQLDEQISSLQQDIRLLDAQIAGLPPDGRTQLDGQRQTKQQTLAQLLKTRDDMRLAAARAENTVSLWEEALPPTERDSPKVALNTLLGIIVAGLLAVLAISLLSYIEDRITDFDAMHEKLGIPPLVEIFASPEIGSFSNKLFVRDAPTSVAAEAFRALRTNILFASVDRRPRTILVTSALPFEGKSVVSANLALAFAHAGSPTVLIDADLRRPSQHRLFGVSSSTGLTTLLTSADPLSELAKFAHGPNLAVVPSGPLPPDPAEFLGSARMAKLLELLSNRTADATVIVDTSPALAVADALALAAKVDGCLFVVDASRTRTASAVRAVAALRRVRARIIGGALNKVRGAGVGYYGYYGAEDGDERRDPRPRGLRRRWLLVPAIGIAILGGTAFLARAGQTDPSAAARPVAPLARALDEVAAARAAWESATPDVLTTRARLETAEAYLAEATDSGSDPRRVSEAALEISRLRAKVDGIASKTTMVVDLGKQYGVASPSALIVAGTHLYALDSGTASVWRVGTGVASPVMQKGQAGMGTPLRLANQDSVLFVLDDAGRLFKLQGDAVSEVRIVQARHGDAVAFDVYRSALYVLDGASGQVWKYAADATGAYRDGAAILDTPLPAGTARSLAVDGDVWIVTTDAQVLRFSVDGTSGIATSAAFRVQWTQDEARPIEVQVRDKDSALALLDDRARRVVVIDRNGREIGRVALPSELSRPAAFALFGDLVYTAHDARVQRTLISR